MALADYEIPPAWLAGVAELTRAIASDHPHRRSPWGRDGLTVLERVAARNCLTAGVYLHEWRRSDPAGMHDHPWDCVSVVLSTGYFELTPEGRRWCPPGEVIFRRAEEPHRIEIIPGTQPRSLFIRGMVRREHGHHTVQR